MFGETGVPVLIDNDVHMAAWGEKLLGAGQDREDVICLTLGTGIGSGIFIQGKLFTGRDESAGEIGHVTVEKDGPRCSCGNYGCLEMYASGRGIARRMRAAIAARAASLVLDLAHGDAGSITAAMVCQAAARGDQAAGQVIKETAVYLGIALAGLANILNPQRIVLGGEVMGAGELLLEPVRRVVREQAMPLNREVEIVAAELGERAGATGAAAIARKEFMLGEERATWTW
ncbi:MAG: ROK family protein [Moorella sp. (in: Bacteria)]|nr:ROK family protein [Moorella sp. (in: firmicutes)]